MTSISAPMRKSRLPSDDTDIDDMDTPRKRAYAASTGDTMLLHVNLPAALVKAIRDLAAEERRTITSQVAILLEESPDLIEFTQG